MGWLRRRPLHERLLAEDDAVTEWHPADFPVGPVFHPGIHGGSRRREWDCVVTANAPGARGDAVRFVVLHGGEVVVEEGDDSGDLSPLADQVELVLDRPYRAQAVRQQRDVFAVGALLLEIVELPGTAANSVILTVQEGARELELDGERVFGGLPALERLGERAGQSYVVRAERVDEELFEVQVNVL